MRDYMKEISEKEFYFLYGYQLSEEYYAQHDSTPIKNDIEYYGLSNTWSELSPDHFAHYLPGGDIPSKFYDDYLKGIETSMDKQLLNLYLKLEGVKK